MKTIHSFLFVLIFQALAAGLLQAQNFIWMSGTNLKNMPIAFDTAAVASTTNTPGGRSHAATWADQKGNLWLYGGRVVMSNISYDKADLWKYNMNTHEWTFVTGTTVNFFKAKYGQQGVPSVTNTPGSRSGCATWTDSNGNLWLFGGKESGTAKYLSDLWKYNPTTNEWTYVKGPATVNQQGVYGTLGQSNSANCPGARSECAYWKDKAGNFWIFGGTETITSSSNLFNDLWKYNLSTNEWTWMNGSNQKNQFGVYGPKGVPSSTITPGARSGMVSMTGKNEEFWLLGANGFGVAGTSGTLNDLWKYDPQNNTWTFMSGSPNINQQPVNGILGLPDPLNQPAGYTGSVGWSDKHGDLWLFGGMTVSGTVYNTLWKYTVIENTWKRMHGSTTVGHPGFYGNKLIASPSNTPPARGGAQAWTDTAQNFWLMGGNGPALNGNGALSDVWKFDYCDPTPLLITSPRPTACIGEELEIKVTGSTTFTWNNGSQANQISLKAISDSTYFVAGRDQSGCLNSTMFTQKTTDCSGFTELRSGPDIIWPNPAKEKFDVAVQGSSTVTIYDLSGAKLLEKRIDESTSIDISTLVQGIYIVRIARGSESQNWVRLVKE